MFQKKQNKVTNSVYELASLAWAPNFPEVLEAK